MAGSADGKKIALVGKSAGNAFFEIAAKAFKETAEETEEASEAEAE